LATDDALNSGSQTDDDDDCNNASNSRRIRRLSDSQSEAHPALPTIIGGLFVTDIVGWQEDEVVVSS
jgi:hypothetical protein